MNPVILYRDDIDWKYEENIAINYFKCINSRILIQPNDLIIPRFSALPFYKEQENDIILSKASIINTYQQHQYIADIGNWYYDLYKETPMTWKNLYEIPDEGPFVLKGETNSKKFLWNTHMFAKNKKEAIDVHTRLLQDSMLQYQKIYIRKYIPLEKLEEGFHGLPITREYRFFIYKNIILSGGFYWSSHNDVIEKFNINPDEVPKSFLNNIIDKIQNTELSIPPNFYVIDVAKTQSGEWILIELNDGSMSGLSNNNPNTLYSNLKNALEGFSNSNDNINK